jgi:hypothetical protein
MYRYLLLFVALLGATNFSLAQTGENETGNWLMYFGQYKVHDKYSIHAEVQYRNHTVKPDLEQLLIRTGLNYHFQKNAFVTLGYGYISSHPYQQDTSIVEHRIWQQLIATQKLGKVKLEHRYRVEQRFIEGDYKNRLRYRAMAFIPLNGNLGDPQTFFLGAYDEIFLNTEQTFFDRNRAYLALGYQINSGTNVQLGVLNQRVDAFDKWYSQLAIVHNIR